MGDPETLSSKSRGEAAMGNGRRTQLVPLAALIGRELRNEKMEKPCVRYGCAAQSRKGEDYFLVKTDCQRVPGNASTSFSVFAVFDGHNGTAAAIFTKENLLNHVLGAIPRGLGREEWLQALPRALVAGFVKTDKEFQSRGWEITQRPTQLPGCLSVPYVKLIWLPVTVSPCMRVPFSQ